MKKIDLQLLRMRQPQQFLTQMDQHGLFTLQSDKSIMRVNADGRGYINTNGQYFYHLSLIEDLQPIILDDSTMVALNKAFALKGDTIGGGVVSYRGLTNMIGDKDAALFNHERTFECAKLFNPTQEYIGGTVYWVRKQVTVSKALKSKVKVIDKNGEIVSVPYSQITLVHPMLIRAQAWINARKKVAFDGAQSVPVHQTLHLPYEISAPLKEKAQNWDIRRTAACIVAEETLTGLIYKAKYDNSGLMTSVEYVSGLS